MKRSLLALLLVCALIAPLCGQQQPAQPQTPPPASDQDLVVRITTNLVQVDAVVTDHAGKQITDLHPEDFEVYEDGHAQKITHFSYITLQPAPPAPVSAPGYRDKNDPGPPPAPPVQLRPEQVHRSIALVIDDLGLSFESTHFVRTALRRFVDEQMQPNDLVAIIRTGAGVGALQQFTTDKQLLHAAIDRVKWNAYGRGGIRAFGAIGDDAYYTEPKDSSKSGFTGSGEVAVTAEAGQPTHIEARESRDRTQINNFKDSYFTIGTLGALNYVVRGLNSLPGRKSVVLVTDSLNLFDTREGNNFRTLNALQHLVDLANRASVVFYTLDPRGLQPLMGGADDALVGKTAGAPGGEIGATGISGGRIMQDLQSRTMDMFASQSGMNYLAQQTGGFLVSNNNDLALGIHRVLDDQKGYYLIGYRPDESTFDPVTGHRNFHRLEVRVKRPGLNVRTRAGFYGVASEQAKPVYHTREQQLLAAITSPFASGGLNLRLTSLFFNDPTYGSLVRSLIHVDGNSLKFTDEAGGQHTATVDVAAMTFDDGGLIVDQRFRTETVHVNEEQYRAALRAGLTFGINLPIKQPGAFQLRVAVRDAATEQVGSANQFIAVPNLKKERLTLSGLYIAGNAAQRQLNAAAHASGATVIPADANTAEGQLEERDQQTGPAVRRFRPGMIIDYGYEAYNLRLDAATHRPHLQTQVRLFHDNQQVFAGKLLDILGQPDSRRLVAFGHLQLGRNLVPGDYVLQVVVTDVAGKEKPRTTTQWLTFEII